MLSKSAKKPEEKRPKLSPIKVQKENYILAEYDIKPELKEEYEKLFKDFPNFNKSSSHNSSISLFLLQPISFMPLIKLSLLLILSLCLTSLNIIIFSGYEFHSHDIINAKERRYGLLPYQE